MAFSKSKFLTFFLLFFFCCSLHLAFANEELMDKPIAQSEIVGQRLPYSQDCCNYGHNDCCNYGHNGNCAGSPNCCGGGEYYCNTPPCGQCNTPPCGQYQSNRCCVSSVCQPSPPCQSCGCGRNNVKVEVDHESDHPSSESIPSKH